MRIDVAALEIGQVAHAGFVERIDSLTDDVTFDAPVTGNVEVSRSLGTVRLRGRLVTTAPFSCGRCLTAFRQPLQVQLDEELLVDPRPGAPAEAAAQRHLDPEDFILPLGPDLVLDVTEVVRQQLLLALPMVPRCRPDCRGLCPQCGVNWNEVRCGHHVADADPRLAPLLELKDRLPDG